MRNQINSLSLRLAGSLMVCVLAGCAGFNTHSATQVSTDGMALHGSVHGGQQPVVGATIQIYAVGTTGDGSAATPLMTQTVTTNANGNFNFASFDCTGVSEVYVTATGGYSGGTAQNTAPNPNLALMTAFGSCASLSTSFVAINELTTAAATSALEPFMTSLTAVGSSSSDASALASAFTLAAQYVNPATGGMPGIAVPSGYSDPAALTYTLGDVLEACVNSTGGVSGDGTLCGNLFQYSLGPGGAVPTDTVQAALNIARNPTQNLSTLYAQVSANPAFQGSLTSAPPSWQLVLQPASAALTRTFFIMPDNGVNQLYTMVNGAQHTIDMTMYELADTTFSGDLVAACARGVKVRVILEGSESSTNSAAYNQLNQAGPNCQAVYANTQFHVTHQKSFIVDEAQVAILSLNLTSKYYGAPKNPTRDYGLIENDPMDIAAIQNTFNADYQSTTSKSYQPGGGDDLIWSPTTATTDLVGIIKGATKTLLVENEEMSSTSIVNALEGACSNGIAVQITMTTDTTYYTNWKNLEAAGCGVHVGKNNTTTLYIHAKALLADYQLPTANAYMGSINFSLDSLTQNRELGLYISDPAIQTTLYNTMTSDYNNTPVFVDPN